MPRTFSGKPEDSVDSFIGYLEPHLEQVPEGKRLVIATSYLPDNAYNWFNVMRTTENANSWTQPRGGLLKRHSPINKVKVARDKLAVCRQSESVTKYNEKFLCITMDIPKKMTEECRDRCMRGLKKYIGTKLCNNEYAELSAAMSHALNIEGSTNSTAAPEIPTEPKIGFKYLTCTPVAIDVSNVGAARIRQRSKDMNDNSCSYCHEKRCRIATCSKRLAQLRRSPNMNNNVSSRKPKKHSSLFSACRGSPIQD